MKRVTENAMLNCTVGFRVAIVITQKEKFA